MERRLRCPKWRPFCTVGDRPISGNAMRFDSIIRVKMEDDGGIEGEQEQDDGEVQHVMPRRRLLTQGDRWQRRVRVVFLPT